MATLANMVAGDERVQGVGGTERACRCEDREDVSATSVRAMRFA